MTAKSLSPLSLCRRGSEFGRQERGGILIEFAFALPILVTLMLGTVNTALYILLHQRMDRAASSISDLVAQPENITHAEVKLAYDAAEHLFGDMFDMKTNGHAIVTSVRGGTTEDPPARINFQIHKECDDASHSSTVGSEAEAEATLPAGLDLQPGESVIVAEVYFEWEPMFFGDLIEAGTQYHVAFRRPRLGAGVLAGGITCS